MRQDRNSRMGYGGCCGSSPDEARGAGQGGVPWGGGLGHCWGGARNAGFHVSEPVRNPGSDVRRGGLAECVETLEKRMKALEERLMGTPPAKP